MRQINTSHFISVPGTNGRAKGVDDIMPRQRKLSTARTSKVEPKKQLDSNRLMRMLYVMVVTNILLAILLSITLGK